MPQKAPPEKKLKQTNERHPMTATYKHSQEAGTLLLYVVCFPMLFGHLDSRSGKMVPLPSISKHLKTYSYNYSDLLSSHLKTLRRWVKTHFSYLVGHLLGWVRWGFREHPQGVVKTHGCESKPKVPFWGWESHPTIVFFKRLFGCSPGYQGFDPQPHLGD